MPQADKIRPVKVQYRSLENRGEMFKNIRRLPNGPFPNLHISDDLNQEQLRFREDLQCLKVIATQKGHDVQLKGQQIIIDSWVYDASNIDNLPIGVSMEDAKTVLCDEDKGIAFQGHYSPLSNFYQTRIQYEDQLYTSVEQGLVHQKATLSNMLDKAQVILQTQDPYALKKLSRTIPETPLWNNVACHYDHCTLKSILLLVFVVIVEESKRPCQACRDWGMANIFKKDHTGDCILMNP